MQKDQRLKNPLKERGKNNLAIGNKHINKD
jgi:hypothetical protein